MRELNEETTLEARIDRLVRTAGTMARGPNDSFELRWAAADEFAQLNLHPVDVREPLAQLLRRG